MRIVVMDEDMREPITVVEIPMSLMRQVQEGVREVRMSVPTSMEAWFTMADKIPNVEMATVRIVSLRMEPIYRGYDILHWVAVPNDPTLALLLRAAFLPGQVTELRRREAQAWFQGAFSAISRS